MTALAQALDGLAGRLAGLAVWQRLIGAGVLGTLGGLAFAPVYQLWLLALALTGLLALLRDCRRLSTVFFTGWLFGFGHFVVGLYWVTQGIVVYSEDLVAFVPIVLIFLPSLMGFYVGLAALTTELACRRFGWRGLRRVLAFAVCWAAAEWLRGVLFTGFPWNLAGYAWGFSDTMLQSVSLYGIHGLSLVTVFVLAAPAIVIEPVSLRQKGWTCALAVAGVAALWVGGAARLAGAEVAYHPNVVLRLVQPSIPQNQKWRREKRSENFLKHVEMSAALPRDPALVPTHVVWPETAAPFFLDRSPQALAALTRVIPSRGLALVGAPRRSPEGTAKKLWNSLLAIDQQGSIAASYDKAHLVPLGEYVPLRKALPLPKVVWGATDYSPGTARRTLHLPDLPPVSPLICYEVIFSGAVADPDDRPEWLLNLTNDAWFGTSTGPHQHFLAARVRSIEEGLPLVRAASTGISGLVDPYGRITHQLGLQEKGILDVRLPRGISGSTLFARLGNWSFALMLAAVVVFVSRSLPNKNIDN